jgi:hypothetical protein
VFITTEADFRKWFEQNLESVGVKRVILSQEACPDYVVEMTDGRVVRMEAELFAVNFRYHRHDPAKVDYILACYSKTAEIDGVPVIAINKLYVWDPQPEEPIPPDTPLTDDELGLLARLVATGGLSVAALGEGSFAGDRVIWIRFPPDKVASFPRGNDESVFTVLPPEAKKFIKRFHHALIGAGLSATACEAIERLQRRRLVKYRPIAFLASLMDGGMINHPAWIPIELYATPEARQRYGAQIRRRLRRMV